MTIQLNIAACYLRLKNYEFAIEVCKRALDRDCTNIKGYYRLGQAYLELGEFDHSIEFIKLGLEVMIQSSFFSLLTIIFFFSINQITRNF